MKRIWTLTVFYNTHVRTTMPSKYMTTIRLQKYFQHHSSLTLFIPECENEPRNFKDVNVYI